MPRPTLLLLLSLLGISTTFQAIAQTTSQAPMLRGRVLDAKTRLPVPYASLSLRTETDWTLANAKGHFKLAAQKKSATDTLLVKCPGYLPRPVVLRNRALPDTILTLEKVVTTPKLQPVNSAPATIQRLGALAKKPGVGIIMGSMGAQFALLMKPSPKHQLGSIRNVSIFIDENGFPKDSFRIRIYRTDGSNHSPGTNLLNDNLIVAAPVGGQWFTVDISKYDVEVPHDGFFVAMEWIVDKGNFSFNGPQGPMGQIMRPTYEFKDSRTWSFTIGKGWQLLTLKTQEAKSYNAMIRAEVEELK